MLMCFLQLSYTCQAPLAQRKLSQAQTSQQQLARIKHVVLGGGGFWMMACICMASDTGFPFMVVSFCSGFISAFKNLVNFIEKC